LDLIQLSKTQALLRKERIMWIVFSIIGGLIYPVFVQGCSKLSKYGHESIRFLTSAALIGIVVAPMIVFKAWHGNAKTAILLSFVGLGYGFGGLFGFRAYRTLNALTISIVNQIMPVLVLVFSWLLLGSKMSALQLLAFAIVMTGTLIAVIEPQKKSRAQSMNGMLFAFGGIIISSLSWVLFNHVTTITKVSPFHVFIFIRIGLLINGLLLFAIPAFREEIFGLFKLGRKQFSYYLNESVGTVYGLMTVFAMVYLPDGTNPSLISLIVAAITQICLFAYFLLRKKEHYIKQKAIGAIIAFSGLLLLALNS
jgi:probable blue pigment (indigoidine) exporter